MDYRQKCPVLRLIILLQVHLQNLHTAHQAKAPHPVLLQLSWVGPAALWQLGKLEQENAAEKAGSFLPEFLACQPPLKVSDLLVSHNHVSQFFEIQYPYTYTFLIVSLWRNLTDKTDTSILELWFLYL